MCSDRDEASWNFELIHGRETIRRHEAGRGTIEKSQSLTLVPYLFAGSGKAGADAFTVDIVSSLINKEE